MLFLERTSYPYQAVSDEPPISWRVRYESQIERVIIVLVRYEAHVGQKRERQISEVKWERFSCQNQHKERKTQLAVVIDQK